MKEEHTFFHPESVDEEIEQAGLHMEPPEPLKPLSTIPNESKEQLVTDLRTIYRPEAEANMRDLEGAWQQIQASDQYQKHFGQLDKKRKDHNMSIQRLQPGTAGQSATRSRKAPPVVPESNFKRTLSMLAAVLLIGAIVGSMALVINAARQKTTVGLGPSITQPTTTAGTGQSINAKVVFTYHDTASDVITAVSWSKDGSRLLSSGTNIQVWDTHNKKFASHEASGYAIYNAKWSPNGKMIADSADSGIEIWNTANGQTLRTCPTPSMQSSILPDLPATQSTTQTVVPLSSSLSLQPQGAGLVDTLNVAWSPDGKYLAATVGTYMSGGTGLVIYDSTNCNIVWQPVARSVTNPQPVSDVTWSPDGKYLAWSVGTGLEVREFASHRLIYTYNSEPVPGATVGGATINKVLWSPNGQRIITVDSIERIAVWDALTGKHKTSYTGHKLLISGIAWSPDSRYIVSGAFVAGQNGGQGEGELRIWDEQSGDTLYISPDHRPTFSVAWSPDGKYVAVSHGVYNTAAPAAGQGKATVLVLAI